MSLGVSSRPSTRAFTTTIASDVEELAVLEHRLGEHHDLDRGAEILEHEGAHEVAALRVLAGEAGDDTGDRADRAVVEILQLRDRALDVAAQHRLGTHERMVAHVEAEHLLLGAQALRLLELDLGDREPVVEHRAVVGVAATEIEEAHRSLVALAPAAQGRVDDGLEHLEQALARMAERVEAARLDQRLDARLLRTVGSTRSQKS